MRSFLILIALLALQTLQSQDITTLYEADNFQALSELSVDIKELSAEECYMLGYAYYRLEKDLDALEWYNAAIDKGKTDGDIYFYRGISLRYVESLEESLADLELSVEKDPERQRNLYELGMAYLYLQQPEKALVPFATAREKEYELGDPYYYLPYTYQYLERYDAALAEYRKSADLINKEDAYYLEILSEIGVLEFTVTQDFAASKAAYVEIIEQVDKTTAYNLYTKLMKCHHALEEHAEADSLFAELKQAYNDESLPKDMLEEGIVAIDEFSWNDRKIIVFKSLYDPEETLDEIYHGYMLNETGDAIEWHFMTEQTIQLPDSAKHLFCSRGPDNTHYTYPVGWESDDIDYLDFKRCVLQVLQDEIQPMSSSNFGK